MSPWLEAAVAKYGSVAFGLAVGTGAKYGLALAEGRRLTLRLLAVDVLLIGMVALLASNVVERLGAEGRSAAMVAALFAVSSDRVLRAVRTRFMRQVDAELQSDLARMKGEIRDEVQAELSARSVIDDQISGRAPAEYEALKGRRQ